MTGARAAIVWFGLALVAFGCAPDGPDVARATCPVDRVACGLQCVDVTADATNCGGCGIPCAAEQSCAGGACRCPAGLEDCNGTCAAAGAADCGFLGDAPVLVTSAPGAYWNTGGALTEVASGNADVTVDGTSAAQVWEGFGGSFNEIGWQALSMLSAQDRDTALRLLYGADGARFAFGRIPIGASDYAIDRYTLAETAGDFSLASFSVERDLERLIPYVKAAQAVKRNIRFWASPWTPPTWMKEGPFSAGNAVSTFDGGTMKADAETMAAFAQYLIKFVEAYAAQGIVVEAVSPQNEPNYTGTYPTCGWSPPTYATFVGQHLGPAVAAAGLATKIMLGTFNGGGSDTTIVGRVLGDPAGRSHVDVLGYQWGMLGQVGGSRRYDLPIWQTEHKCGNYPWAKPFDAVTAPNDHAYAVESWRLIRDWIRAGATAYSAWNMVLDTTGVGIDTTRVWPQNALLAVDLATKTLLATPAYYVFRHLSRFVAVGARVVATRGGDALAFRNPDGSAVAVLYNAGPAKVTTLAVAGKKLRFEMPGDGWTTVRAR
jgi:glucosylceramidase